MREVRRRSWCIDTEKACIASTYEQKIIMPCRDLEKAQMRLAELQESINPTKTSEERGQIDLTLDSDLPLLETSDLFCRFHCNGRMSAEKFMAMLRHGINEHCANQIVSQSKAHCQRRCVCRRSRKTIKFPHITVRSTCRIAQRGRTGSRTDLSASLTPEDKRIV